MSLPVHTTIALRGDDSHQSEQLADSLDQCNVGGQALAWQLAPLVTSGRAHGDYPTAGGRVRRHATLSWDLVERVCPLCGSADSSLLFEDLNRREAFPIAAPLVECRTCRMRYLRLVLREEDLGLLYREGIVDPADIPTAGNPGAGARWSVVSQALRRLHHALKGHPHNWPDAPGYGRSLLDFGCHDGAKLLYWRDRGWIVAGIDLNEGAIRLASSRLPDGKFWAGDISQLHLDDRFDVIRSDNVLEHILDPVDCLGKLGRLLKERGRMQMIVPNAAGVSARLLGKYSYVHWVPFHVNLFTPRTLRKAVESAGLRVLHVRTFTPNGAWAASFRQLLLAPGYDRRQSRLDKLIRRFQTPSYPGEAASQWIGLGEEIVLVAARR